MISQKGDVKIFIGLIVVIVIGFGLMYLGGFLVYGFGYRIGQQEVLDEHRALSCLESYYHKGKVLEVTFEISETNTAKKEKSLKIINDFNVEKDEKIEKLERFLEEEKEEKGSKILIFHISYTEGQKLQICGDYFRDSYNPPYERIIRKRK